MFLLKLSLIDVSILSGNYSSNGPNYFCIRTIGRILCVRRQAGWMDHVVRNDLVRLVHFGMAFIVALARRHLERDLSKDGAVG